MQILRKFARKLNLGSLVRAMKRTKAWKYYTRQKAALRAVAQFRGKQSAVQKIKLLRKIERAWKKYGFIASEYFLFHVEQRTEEELRQFVSDTERFDVTTRMNRPENQQIFDDKEKTYQHFRQYYRREVLFVADQADAPAFYDFLSRHPRFIAKPRGGNCGTGVQVITHAEGQSAQKLLASLLHSYRWGFVAEQIIRQTQAMAQFHPESVNTVRMPTVRFDDRVEVLPPFFRLGRGDACVDNGGAGGIITVVDTKTGTVLAAADERGNTYTTHPESGVPIIGFQIPRWEEAMALAAELAQVIPSNRYAGWDLALTDDGWVMVEGNARGQFLWQIPLQKGFRKELESIRSELNL